MAITSKPFSQLVTDMATAIQGKSASLVDLSIGSILRAIIESAAGVVLWIQGLILTLLATTRASTSNASDLDTWMADFGLTRLAAVAATGNVTFSRFTTTNQATIAPGVVVQTLDGTQQYTVVAQATNPAWNVGLSAYVIGAGVASVSGIPVQANTAGAAGNAAPGAISSLGSAVPYVDSVTNPTQFTTGSDAEKDAAFRARFQSYINTLSRGTPAAIKNAVTGLGNGMYCTVLENINYAGAAQQGYLTIVVDDGTGAPSSARITSAINAIEAVRPAGITYGVFSPVIVTVAVAMTVTVASGFDPAATKTLVQTAVQNFLNTLTLGQGVAYTRLLQVAYDASTGVQNVSAYTLAGGTSDVSISTLQVAKAGTVTIS